jgi:hypothetical protein
MNHPPREAAHHAGSRLGGRERETVDKSAGRQAVWKGRFSRAANSGSPIVMRAIMAARDSPQADDETADLEFGKHGRMARP